MKRGKIIDNGVLKMFVRTFDDLVEDARDYIKENYHIDSIYDKKARTIRLIANNADYALNILAAREYILDERIEIKIITGEENEEVDTQRS